MSQTIRIPNAITVQTIDCCVTAPESYSDWRVWANGREGQPLRNVESDLKANGFTLETCEGNGDQFTWTFSAPNVSFTLHIEKEYFADEAIVIRYA